MTTAPAAAPPGPGPEESQASGLSQDSGSGLSQDGGLSRDWLAPFSLDVRLVLGVHRHGGGDPTFRAHADGSIWKTSLTPAGPATLRVTIRRGPTGALAAASTEAASTRVLARAWGPGAGWMLESLPDLLGARDRPGDFRPAHPLLRELAFRHAGGRIGRTGRIMEALVPAVLEQKVVGLEAFRSWRLLVRRFGLPAPGPAPAGMLVCPPAATWAAVPSWEWHRAGVEGVRAATIRGAAKVAGRLEEIPELPSDEADRRLRSLPGIGVWTSAEVRQRACGDADALSVGDYNLPGAVGWALAGRKVDDAGMLELLAPYAGHRHRAARLIELSGIHPPRRGPRNPVRDYRAF